MRTLLTSVALVLATACGENASAVKNDAPLARDAGTDATVGPDAACFENPQTDNELANGCTTPDVERIFKPSNPPLLNPDGTLPPLPP